MKIRTELSEKISKKMGDPLGTKRVEYWNPHTQNYQWGMIYTLEELKKYGKEQFYRNCQTIKIEQI